MDESSTCTGQVDGHMTRKRPRQVRLTMATNLDRAIEIVQRAIDEDIKQNYPEAYKQYQNALDYLWVQSPGFIFD